MPTSLNGIEHMYIVTVGLHMMNKSIICDRWVHMYVLPSGRLERVFMITTTWKCFYSLIEYQCLLYQLVNILRKEMLYYK
jgi:hypothetical protein